MDDEIKREAAFAGQRVQQKLAAYRERRPLRHRPQCDRHAMGSGSTSP